MKRRALLVALAPLTAGCFGSTQAQSDEPAETSGETPTHTPTETPTATPTETPTETPNKELSAEQKEAIEKIHTAQDRFTDAVYLYTGGVSSDLTDISADTDEFDDRSVLLKLSDVQTAINEARQAAVTAEQTRTIESLGEMHRFLTQATDLQAWLIEGHEAVADTYDAINDEDDEETVKAQLDALGRAVENASEPLGIINSIEPEATDSTEAISVDEYERKRTQFEQEMDVLGQLHDALSTIRTNREELDAARTKADDGDYDSAEQAADRAAERLDETVDTLQNLDDDLPTHAGAFEDQIENVLALARDYAAEADDLHDRYD